MNHYFTDNRHLTENRKEISFRFWCFNCRFITDSGVFSKNAIDYGSRVLLDAIYHEGKLSGNVLDVGCGYGIIGIVLKKAFQDIDLMMIDVNPRAVQLASENVKHNQVEAEVLVSDTYTALQGKVFRHIVSNPPIRAGKKVVYTILEGAYQHLENNGCLWVVIRKQQGALSAKAKLEEVYGNCEIIKKDKGYYILKSVKRD